MLKWILIVMGLGGLAASLGGSAPAWVVVRQFSYRGYDVAILQNDSGFVQVSGPSGQNAPGDPDTAKRYATADEAEAAAREAIDLKHKLPVPTMEGETSEGPLAGSRVGRFVGNRRCDVTRIDGPYRVCLSVNEAGRWSYRATEDGEEIRAGEGYDDRTDALVASWQGLLALPVTFEPRTRDGVRLNANGSLTLLDSPAFAAKAVPLFSTQLAEGNDDGDALLLAVLGAVFPAVNLLRLRPNGDPSDAVEQRIDAAGNAAAKAAAIFATPPILVALGEGSSIERWAPPAAPLGITSPWVGDVYTIVYDTEKPDLAPGQVGVILKRYRAWPPGVSPQEGTEIAEGTALDLPGATLKAHQAIVALIMGEAWG